MRTHRAIHRCTRGGACSGAGALAASQGSPTRTSRILAGACLLLGLLGLPASGVAGTGRLLSSWMSRPPRIDGQIGAAEWSAATLVNMYGGVSVRIGNDRGALFLAVFDPNDTTAGSNDGVFLYFDDEGGAAPVLDDGVWTNAICQTLPDVGEGSLFFWPYFQSITFLEYRSSESCQEQQLVTDRASFVGAVGPEGRTYEIAIPLDGSTPLRAGPGQRLGIWLLVQRDGTNPASCLPCDTWEPSGFLNLILASGGCNSGPQTFGSGNPQTGLPLDWTSEIRMGGGQGWIQSLPPYWGAATRCRSNETGGSGAAACVANFYYSEPQSKWRLRMPLSLAGYTAAEVRLRARLVVDPAGNGEYDALLADVRLQDGTTKATQLYWLGQDQSSDVVLPLDPGGSSPVELWFTHSTFAAGGTEGGYAQIDDVELLCDPLFVDDFERGDTSAW